MSERHKAILLIHGILGSPSHFNFLLDALPEDVHIEPLLLSGHGGNVKDFSKARMKNWKKEVSLALEKLRQKFEKVIIVSHSMGSLFALEEGEKGSADALFLINIPLKVKLTKRLFEIVLRVYRDDIPESDERLKAAKDYFSIELERNPLRYLPWIGRYIELFREIGSARKVINDVSIPTRLYLSHGDEMVSLGGASWAEENKSITLKILKDSGHYFYAEDDKRTMMEDLVDLISST